MYNETISVEVDIRQKMDVDVHISDVMHAINQLELTKKWNIIGGILKGLKLNGLDEDNDEVSIENKLTDEQKTIIKEFLKKQLSFLQ